MDKPSELQSGSYFKTVMILSLAIWLVVMNTTMFNVALPNILRDFSITASEGAWVVSGYSIVLAICTITYTRLSDYLPIRRLIAIGIMLFGFSSILGFFAESYSLLLLARLLQATGAAAIPGLSMVFASRFIPLSNRGRAMAMIASASSLGFGLGPVVGGVITEHLAWNYLFVVTLLVILLVPVLLRILPKEEVQKGKFDFIGAVLTGSSVTAFLLFLSTFHWIFFAAGILMLFLLWLRINKAELPFIQPDLVKDKRYRLLLYISFLGFLTHFAILLLMPLMLGDIFSKNPSAIGFIIFPGAMFSAVAAIYVGRLIDRYGNYTVLLGAHGLLLISTVIFFFLSPLSEYWIMAGYMFTSFGFSSLSSSSTNEASRILSKEYVGSGIGMKQLTHFVGSASGSVAGAILLEWNGDVFTSGDFQRAYLALIGAMAVSLILLFVYKRQEK
ncbi:multidrug efflux MFS transporter [Rossellomorea vietnamensis]|uniref:Multidrug efflux MFS transporter n=1 Tax=Rossellomorea vietnamensis TaxID=218284 RepID=A0A5D4MDE7_9BACI|nr:MULTISPECIES: MFS transporter [Bacillaceae]TYR99884.1 multidrug efflux MFS transporter [Rossellomorea vietnamensis]